MANRPQPDGRTPRHFHSRGKRSPLSEHDDARIENIRWRSGSTPRKTNARGLACPFLKAFPNTPQWNLNGTCARHSWPSIPRLKYIISVSLHLCKATRTNVDREHLYRCHAQNSLSCPRCVASFEKPADLDDHLRSAEPCKVANRKDSVQQTINSMQIDRLRKRKGTYGQNDIQKWYEIWDILFPDRQRPSSPCEFSFILLRFIVFHMQNSLRCRLLSMKPPRQGVARVAAMHYDTPRRYRS